MAKIILQTKNCIYCLDRKATLWSGHVKRKNETIIAGWCKSCYKKSNEGYRGHYRREMKVEDYFTE